VRLNRLCLKIAGKSAFEMTQDRLMLEACRKLTYVPAGVASIAYELGFQDPAYFSRLFKKLVGMTPKEYRLRTAAWARRQRSHGALARAARPAPPGILIIAGRQRSTICSSGSRPACTLTFIAATTSPRKFLSGTAIVRRPSSSSWSTSA
jgi:hypothetical protein